jgi:regulator of PEP synthase PpsR (kinase-PPPase family)
MARTVFFVSDSTGITAETLGHSLLTQFENFEYREVTLPFIDSIEDAQAAARLIDRAAEQSGERPIVYATLADSKLLEVITSSNALVLDVFGVFISPLEGELRRRAAHTKGRTHGLTNKVAYDVRMEAINFALDHDDGASTRRYRQADVVIAAVSRSGKTPTCLYLAMQFGIHAANFPLTEEDLDHKRMPRLLQDVRGRIYGLTIDPERLHKIRTERRPNSHYASLARCREEVIQAEELFEREQIPFLNTTSVSIEEIATRILQDMRLRRRLF